MNDKLRILIVDDHAIVREGISRLINEQADMCVAGEAGSLSEGLRLMRTERFAVIIVDLTLGDGTGWDLLKATTQLAIKPAVLLLTALGEEHIGLEALKAGADGFLNKQAPTAEILTAIRRLGKGGKYITGGLAEALARKLSGEHLHNLALSPRELHILCAIASGESLVSIAEDLHISPKTVTTYRRRLLEKLGLENNAGLTRYAVDKGILKR